MYDAKKVIPGLAIFVILACFPFWARVVGESPERPQLTLPQGEAKCVESKEFMTQSHMQLLDDWRDAAIRDGTRLYVASDGTEHTMSLTNTCLRCHTSRDDFCTKCHDYAGVSPYCWDCHVEPAGGE